MIKKANRNAARKIRSARVRAKISGTANRPRLNVFRSSKHIYAQLIDDEAKKTLVSASSLDKDFKSDHGGNQGAAKEVGLMIAKRAKEKNVEEIVFDRGGYLYHGRVKKLAEAAREGGLKF